VLILDRALSGLPIVAVQHAAKSLSLPDRPDFIGRRERRDQPIVEALMIALDMIMSDIFGHDLA
jgi:hypothetical protein